MKKISKVQLHYFSKAIVKVEKKVPNEIQWGSEIQTILDFKW